jgi:hypothetical protein
VGFAERADTKKSAEAAGHGDGDSAAVLSWLQLPQERVRQACVTACPRVDNRALAFTLAEDEG